MLSLPKHRALACLLALAACSEPAPDIPSGETILCSLDGAKAFENVCTVEKSRRDGVETVVIRHPDGAFRRIDVLDDGRVTAVADGASRAVTRYVDGFAEVTVENDRYRFPVQAPGEADSQPAKNGP